MFRFRLSIPAILLISATFVLCAGSSKSPASPANKKLNVVVIVLDTLGAKHLGCYDSTLSNSPRIDALAKDGALFTQAYATSSWTKPSIASVLTSKMPSRHGVIGPSKKLSLEIDTMAELFKNAGYKTIGVVSHTFLGQNTGYQQGFDEYYQLNNTGKVHSLLTSNLVSDQGIASLEQQLKSSKDGNFFLFLHFFDPHFRYQHHQKFDQTSSYHGNLKPGMTLEALERAKNKMTPEDIGYLVGLHHEEISYTDSYIGKVLDFLNAKGLRKNTLVVITGDHGEGFLEHHYLGHTVSLYEELVHVPLVFSLPGTIAPKRLSAPVSLLDILPSVAALSGLSPQNGWEGQSLLPELTGTDKPQENRPIFMEVSYLSHARNLDPNIVGVRNGSHKVLYDLNRKRWSLFDLSQDPHEHNNLAKTNPEELKRLGAQLSELRDLHAELRPARTPAAEEIQMPSDEIKKLKSLGYF